MDKKIILGLISLFCFRIACAENVFVYLLKHQGNVVYCGITNDPDRRAREHVENHTMRYSVFDKMLVFAGPMSRESAYQEETNCIYNHLIPNLYQTKPQNNQEAEYQRKAQKDYELRIHATQLIQVQNPIVEYSHDVLRAIEKWHAYVCEDCGTNVTNGVIDYSHKHFGGHVYCMGCQYNHIVCENCGTHVTDGVIDYSQNHFDGHVYCMKCQRNYK